MPNVIDLSGGMGSSGRRLTPQEQLAQAMLQQGVSGAPVRHPMEGIGRIAQALAGAYIGKQGQESREKEAASSANAMMGAAGKVAAGIPAWTDPDTGQKVGADVSPGLPALQAVMSSSRDPVSQLALQRAMPQLLQYAQAYQKEQPKAPEGFKFNAQGALEPIQGYVEGKGALARATRESPDEAGMRARATRETPQEAAQRAGAVAAAQTPYQIQAARGGRETPEEAAAKAAAVEAAKMKANPVANNKEVYAIEGKLRDDFNQFQPVKSFRQAAPIITSMREAVNRNTAGADLNLVYGIAKIFDPDSVVREGEMVLVKSTANLPQQVQGYLSFVMGGGRLTPEIRNNLMQEAESRYSAYKSGYDAAAMSVQGMAARMGANPENVIMGGLTPDARPNAPKTPAAASPTADAPAGKKPEEMSMEELKAKLGIK